MGLRINQYTRTVQRNMAQTSREIQRSQRNISRGKRVVSAADDGLGARMIQTLETQVRGYAQSARNAYDGMGLVRTADGAFGDMTEALHRMREIAIHSASDVQNKHDRVLLQKGMSELVEELGRIASDTNFNSKKLLDGTLLDNFVHIGPGYKENAGLSIEGATPHLLARYAVLDGDKVTEGALEAGELLINGITIRKTQESDDLLSTTLRRASAVAKAAAINDFSLFSGVKAQPRQALRSSVGDVAGGTLDGRHYVEINGWAVSHFDVDVDDAKGILVQEINELSDRTGVIAQLDTNHRLNLVALDGRNIDLKTYGDAHHITGLRTRSGQDITMGSLSFYSEDLFQVTSSGVHAHEQKIGLVENAMVGRNTDEAVSTIDVSTRDGANRALTIIDRALESVLHRRGKLGALQNRLEFNLSRSNTSAMQARTAQVSIESTDFASESADLARNQIVQEAFVNVLAQANTNTRSVLTLL